LLRLQYQSYVCRSFCNQLCKYIILSSQEAQVTELKLRNIELSLPAVSTVEGNHDLNIGLDTLNFSTLDVLSGNNAATATFHSVAEPKSLPYRTDFADESYDGDWLLQPSGDYLLPWSWGEETESIITEVPFSFSIKLEGKKRYFHLYGSKQPEQPLCHL